MSTFEQLPENLAIPQDDGAAAHLVGARLPDQELPSTSSVAVDLATIAGRVVVYVYPMTGQPGVALPENWDNIPGARGCTPESCDFRDHLADLRLAGVDEVFGVSSQSTLEQAEARERLHLPFDLLSDADFSWADALRLPSFVAAHRRFHSRITLVASEGQIEHVFYPVFPPDTHAQQVLAWVKESNT